MCHELETDIIAFAYRGFSHSDGFDPDEEGIMLDVKAMGTYFEN